MKGLFAANLTNNYWRYNASDANVFSLVCEARARAMPPGVRCCPRIRSGSSRLISRSPGGMTLPRLPFAWQIETTAVNAQTPSNKRQP